MPPDFLGRSRLVAVMTRMSTLMEVLEPIRSNSRSWRMQQLGLGAQRHLADLVEEDGALVGAFEAALAHGHGAGEGPFSWPNSSVSSRVSGSVAQLTFTSGWGLRLLARCSASATSSFRSRTPRR